MQLTVLFARQALAADRPADAQGPDHRELLRYMYLHCGQKLTLQQLADVFGCSRSTVSAQITAMTGLSFSTCSTKCASAKPPTICCIRT